ncbi:MAG: hypothetical protein AAGF11_38250 [Myxococcota bacterium]
MNNHITIDLLATIDTSGISLESDALGQDAAGQVLELPCGSWATVEFRLRGKDPYSHQRLAEVRSVPTPDFGQGPWTPWTQDAGDYVSPIFVLGDEFRVEVAETNRPPTPPVGGGHFRIVEEGGGFTLVATAGTHTDSSHLQVGQP